MQSETIMAIALAAVAIIAVGARRRLSSRGVTVKDQFGKNWVLAAFTDTEEQITYPTVVGGQKEVSNEA